MEIARRDSDVKFPVTAALDVVVTSEAKVLYVAVTARIHSELTQRRYFSSTCLKIGCVSCQEARRQAIMN
jgi:hypothetical protein